MSSETPDQSADRLVQSANTAFSGLEKLMTGTGEQFQAFQSLSADARMIAQIGSQAADNIKSLRDDALIPADVKRVRQERIEETAEALLKDVRKTVIQRVEGLEQSLMAQIQPPAQTDPTKSLLARQELDMHLSAATAKPGVKPPMLGTLVDLALANPNHAAEILGPWGQAQMVKAGEQQFIGDLRNNVVRILARTPGGNEKAKAALLALPQVKGHIDGYIQAARFRLDPLKQAKPDTIAPPRETLMSSFWSSDFTSKTKGKR